MEKLTLALFGKTLEKKWFCNGLQHLIPAAKDVFSIAVKYIIPFILV